MVILKTKAQLAANCFRGGDVTVKCNDVEKGVLTADAPALTFSAQAADGRFEVQLISPSPIPSGERCNVTISSDNAHATIPTEPDQYTWRTMIVYNGEIKPNNDDPDDPPPPEIDTNVEVSEDEL